jgi:hypothetical protein
MPRLITFVTIGTPYEREVGRLERSVAELGLRVHVARLPNRGSWVKNCACKGQFVLDCLREFDEPIVWLDSDAELLRYPELFEDADFEFAAYWTSPGKTLLSGTLYFAPTGTSVRLVEGWARRCEERPHKWDQTHLRDEFLSTLPLESCFRLPQGYCKIFDRVWREPSRVEYIRHYQASRRFKRLIT